jgi:hypothetical protein
MSYVAPIQHRDESQPDQWPLPNARRIKSFVYRVYLSDVEADGGLLAAHWYQGAIPSTAVRTGAT